jgi:hypothetical protein
MLTVLVVLFAPVHWACEVSVTMDEQGFPCVDVRTQHNAISSQHFHKYHTGAGHLGVVKMLDSQP